jgi:hypothetical protein
MHQPLRHAHRVAGGEHRLPPAHVTRQCPFTASGRWAGHGNAVCPALGCGSRGPPRSRVLSRRTPSAPMTLTGSVCRPAPRGPSSAPRNWDHLMAVVGSGKAFNSSSDRSGMGFTPSGSAFALLGVVELALLRQDEAVGLRLLDDLRRPDHAAAGIVAAEDRHDHPVIGADVLEAPEDAGGDVEDVALLQHDFARIAPAPPEEAPAPRQDEEHLRRAVGMERVAALGRLPAAPMLKPCGQRDVHMLIGGLRTRRRR